MDIKNVTSESKEELSVEEVNVYGWYEYIVWQIVSEMVRSSQPIANKANR